MAQARHCVFRRMTKERNIIPFPQMWLSQLINDTARRTQVKSSCNHLQNTPRDTRICKSYTVSYPIWPLKRTYESECHWMTLFTDKELSSLKLNNFSLRWQEVAGWAFEHTSFNPKFLLCHTASDFPTVFWIAQASQGTAAGFWQTPTWDPILHLSLNPL